MLKTYDCCSSAIVVGDVAAPWTSGETASVSVAVVVSVSIDISMVVVSDIVSTIVSVVVNRADTSCGRGGGVRVNSEWNIGAHHGDTRAVLGSTEGDHMLTDIIFSI
jgi:hypothetical protein